MIDSDVVVVRGIPEHAHDEVAQLYWEAFQRKLGPSLGDREQGERFLRGQLNPDGFLCAMVSGRVVGVLGFHDRGRPAVDISFGSLVKAYSFASALWRAALLVFLGRSPRTGELLLDGISVSSAARGQGVGTRLLDEAVALAEERGLSAVRLSVVDTNPRARALYERRGFVATGSSSVGILEGVYGFRTATDMEFKIRSGGAS